MTVAAYLRQWLEAKELDLERSTAELYRGELERHIIPFFQELGIELDELRPLDIRAYVTSKRKDGRLNGKGGLSSVTVRKQLNIIKQALRDAVLYELIPRSPADAVKIPKSGQISRTVRFIGVDEAREVLTALEGHRLYPLVYVTLMYGLRRSEALGLRWDAVDFERAEFWVRHTVVKNLTIECKDRTKTESSRRLFPLLPEIAQLLSSLPRRSDYIFTWPDGRLYRPDDVTRGFQRALLAHGLARMRFHDLRHATASILFDRGWSLADVQHWLGHSDIETTKNIYIAYTQRRKLRLGGELSGIFGEPKTVAADVEPIGTTPPPPSEKPKKTRK